jgi:uncharacterized protein (DUF342 family)
VAPVDGVDGTVAFLIKTEKGPKIKENADGTVDFHDLDMVENVTQGQVLCTVTLPTEGTPGTTVEGNAILQRKGRPVPNTRGATPNWSRLRAAPRSCQNQRPGGV